VANTGKRHTLCKDERLSRRKIIESLHERGASIKSPAIILVYLPCPLPVAFPAQAMFSASKRLFKRAHDRNRVKRLLREAYRKQKHVVYSSLNDRNQQCALHFIFTGKQLPNYAYVFGKMNDLILRFCNEASKFEANENPIKEK